VQYKRAAADSDEALLKKARLISKPDMESKYPIITAREFKLLFWVVCLNAENQIGAETDFWFRECLRLSEPRLAARAA
jgi:hypothetical protein